jgi:NADH-quinone oxidoreductase subunit J
LALVVFYILSAVTLFAAAGVVTTRNVVYAALFLLTALAATAGLFVLLLAEFLALVQVLIYGGAIVIVLLFAIMLTRSNTYETSTEHRQWPIAAIASAVLFGLITASFFNDAERFNSTIRNGVDLETLSTELFTTWAIPFEVASVVLLIALIGALVIAHSDGKGEES